ncbi:hypothetical protein F5883DRAFT_164337 [Diaporthe sp. PMI_573]|nr:hypothetical protein F5883DRAFT_164337 [Diaporthaceae sp. PMI_573]
MASSVLVLDICAARPPPPPLSPPPIANKKRRQARTPSLSPSSPTPNYRTWKHLDLACGEREKMMCELLRRMAKKEKNITDLMNNMEAKEAVVDEKITSLTLLLAQVQEKEAALREAGGMQSVDQGRGRVQEPGASEDASTAPPTPSGGLVSTASVSSNISDRVQTRMAAQIDRLREEIACEYATSDEVDLLLSGSESNARMAILIPLGIFTRLRAYPRSGRRERVFAVPQWLSMRVGQALHCRVAHHS